MGWCMLLAALNACEAWLCAMDWRETPTRRNLWALLAWLGSTAFWVVRAWAPA